MVELLKRILTGQNQFASGGLLLMIIGGISVYLRAVPMKLWDWLVDQVTMSITIKDDDAAFQWIKEWFLDQKFMKHVRRLDVDTSLRGKGVCLLPAPGHHWFWRSGRPFRVDFYRTEETNALRTRRHESLLFRTIGRHQSLVGEFVNEVVKCHRRNVGLQSHLYIYNDGWDRVYGYAPRLLESVILHAGEKERLVDDVRKFKNSKERYRMLGVPYHRGYLFHGPPGTGKTSLISALAGQFGMSIYTIQLTQFNDRSLVNAISDVEQHSVIMFEDIDCMKSSEARPRPQTTSCEMQLNPGEMKTELFGVTLSGLLNALDGFTAPDDVLFVMTSNRIEALDPALLRPGRIDYRLYLGHATDEQKIELYGRFFPQASLVEAQFFVAAHADTKTMAEFQGLLLGFEGSGDSGNQAIQLLIDAPESIAS